MLEGNQAGCRNAGVHPRDADALEDQRIGAVGLDEKKGLRPGGVVKSTPGGRNVRHPAHDLAHARRNPQGAADEVEALREKNRGLARVQRALDGVGIVVPIHVPVGVDALGAVVFDVGPVGQVVVVELGGFFDGQVEGKRVGGKHAAHPRGSQLADFRSGNYLAIVPDYGLVTLAPHVAQEKAGPVSVFKGNLVIGPALQRGLHQGNEPEVAVVVDGRHAVVAQQPPDGQDVFVVVDADYFLVE